MSIPVRWLTEKIAICGQIGPEHLGPIAKMGFKSVICNRPDDEFGIGQPKADDVKTAAEAAGLVYAFLPVTPDGGTGMDAKEMGTLLANMPTPILAYCKTGGRCMALIGTAARMGYPIPH
jgi:sulfide:quinone oxidoreductase